MDKDSITDYWIKATKEGKIPHIRMQISEIAAKKCNLTKKGKQEFMDTGIEITVNEIHSSKLLFRIDGTDADKLYQKLLKISKKLQELNLGTHIFLCSMSK